MLKHFQSVPDARRAATIGVQGIVFSNHGGRRQDGSIGYASMCGGYCGTQDQCTFDSGGRKPLPWAQTWFLSVGHTCMG